MSRYRVIHCMIWGDDKFPFASDDTQLIIFHLLTTPLSTPFGLYKASLEALAAEKRWSLKRYKDAIADAIEMPFLEYDERHQVIWLINALEYNLPNGPNQAKAWGKLFEEIPNSPLKTKFYQKLIGITNGMSNAMSQVMRDAFVMPSPIQEQEQEQEQEKKVSIVASEPVRRIEKEPYPKLARLSGNAKNRVYPSAFNAFWQPFPKRPTDTKAGAYEHWRITVLKGRATCDELIAASKTYGEFCSRTGHEALLVKTWCRREGWTASHKGEAGKADRAEAADSVQRTMEEMFSDG